MDYPALGRRIRERRRELDLSQEELAEKTGISTSFIGHLERAEKIPSLETAVKLSLALETDVNYLVYGRTVQCDGGCPLYAELAALLRAYGHG